LFRRESVRQDELLRAAVTYLVRLGKGTAVYESKGLFEHDPSANENDLPLEGNGIFNPVM